jgi:hypothetical protein
MMSTDPQTAPEYLLRYMMDRERTTEELARESYRRWQKVVRELEFTRAELAAIKGSAEYKVLPWLRVIFGAPQSFRRRFCGTGFRGVRWAARRLAGGLRRCVRFPRPIGSGERSSPDSLGPPASEALPVPGGQSSVQDGSQGQSFRQPAPDKSEELAYRPERWPLPEHLPSEAELLDLLILAPIHRTGSTLLQRICNARKGTLIWGEHGGILTRFSTIFADAALFSLMGQSEREAYFRRDEDPNLWIANMCPELECVQQALIDSARALLSTLYGRYRKDHDILGFKEVQYGRAELELLRRCYPKAHFLLLLRNPLDTWKSTPKDWYPSFDNWIAKYNEGVWGYCEFAEHDAHCHVLRYEDLIAQEPDTMAVLAEVAKVSKQEVSMVLAHKIGSTRRSILDNSQREVILAHCRAPMEVLKYL